MTGGFATGPGPTDQILVHICEVCGEEKTMTSQEGFDEGWDYPPAMGVFGVLSARTCGNCGIDQTLWWKVAIEKKVDNFTDEEKTLFARIMDEPESIRPKEE